MPVASMDQVVKTIQKKTGNDTYVYAITTTGRYASEIVSPDTTTMSAGNGRKGLA